MTWTPRRSRLRELLPVWYLQRRCRWIQGSPCLTRLPLALGLAARQRMGQLPRRAKAPRGFCCLEETPAQWQGRNRRGKDRSGKHTQRLGWEGRDLAQWKRCHQNCGVHPETVGGTRCWAGVTAGGVCPVCSQQADKSPGTETMCCTLPRALAGRWEPLSAVRGSCLSACGQRPSERVTFPDPKVLDFSGLWSGSAISKGPFLPLCASRAERAGETLRMSVPLAKRNSSTPGS